MSLRVTKAEYDTLNDTVTIYRELVNAGRKEFKTTLLLMLDHLRGVEIIPEQTWPEGPSAA